MNDVKLFLLSGALYVSSALVYDGLRSLGASIVIAGSASFAVIFVAAAVLTYVNLFR